MTAKRTEELRSRGYPEEWIKKLFKELFGEPSAGDIMRMAGEKAEKLKEEGLSGQQMEEAMREFLEELPGTTISIGRADKFKVLDALYGVKIIRPGVGFLKVTS